jgi:hypothetical protein
MPYCGRCLNVGRNLDTGVLFRQAQPTPHRASMRFCGKPALLGILSGEYLDAGTFMFFHDLVGATGGA